MTQHPTSDATSHSAIERGVDHFGRFVSRLGQSWEDHREKRWYKYRDRIAKRENKDPEKARRKRSPQRQKFLVALYFAALVVAVVGAITQLFYQPGIWLWTGASLVIIVSWTMLRSAIDIKDDAPVSALDEYEIQVVARWRKLAYEWLTYALVVFLTIMLTAGAIFRFQDVPLHSGEKELLGFTSGEWMYTWSLFLCIAILAICSLPALGYTLEIAAQPEEEQPDELVAPV